MTRKKLAGQVAEIGSALNAIHTHMQNSGYYFEDSTLPLFKQVVSALHEFDRIKLSEEDARFLLNLLENPPEPNEALQQAFERHQMLINNTGK